MIERPQIIITPKGTSGFSCVEEARSFKNMTVTSGDRPAPRSYSQVLILDRKEGEAFVESLKKPIELLRDKEIEKRKAAGKSTRFSAVADVTYKDVPGEDKISLSFKRPEHLGKLPVVDSDGNTYTSRITPQTILQVAFELVPYVYNNVFGGSLILSAVQVLGIDTPPIDAIAIFGITKKDVQGGEHVEIF